MVVEIVLSSSDDDNAGSRRARRPVTVAISDSSDEEPRAKSASAARPSVGHRPAAFAGPSSAQLAFAGGAARKSGFGAGQFPRRRTLVTKHGVQQPSQRAPTQRTVVKAEPDDGAALASLRALRSEDSIANALDPRLEAIPFPFDVSIRLEEIRLALKRVPTHLVVELDIAFRNVDQSTNTASPAASTSFLLPLPPTFAPGSLVDFCSGIEPRSRLLCISRNPIIPLDSSDPSSSSFAARYAQPDVRDVLIRLSIVDAGAPSPERLYESATSMTEDARLCLTGERALRRSAEGSQVKVSWTVDLRHDGHGQVPPTDDELRRWLEQEMRRCEAEWRRETAERALALSEIDSQQLPRHGPPTHLVLDPNAPPPASLIPGPDILHCSPPPLDIAPVPRYHHTSFANRSVPLVGSLLESFPQTKHWETPGEANAFVEERVQSALDPGSDEETDEVQDRYKAEQERLVEIAWRRKELIDCGSFAAPDPGRTVRDFSVLKRLFSHLQVDLVELAQLEREAKKQDEAENRVDLGNFPFERSLTEDNVLRRALKIFEEKTGRTAYRVQQDHRLIDDEQIIQDDDGADFCWLCGAHLCAVHAGTLLSCNEPTKASFDPTEHVRGGCDECGSSSCFMLVEPDEYAQNLSVDAVSDALEKALLADGMPALDPCTASLLLQRPVDEDKFAFAEAQERGARPSKSDLTKADRVVLHPVQSSGYSPCACVDQCTSECACSSSETYCDRWCACPSSCPRRFRGCTDRLCDSSACLCRDRCRECDPQICGCDASTCANSAIRLGRHKATSVVRSQIPQGGYGAVLLEAVEKGEFVALYGGEQHPQGLTENPTLEAKWGHWRTAFSEGVEQSYWFDVDRGDATDSALLGNVIRFVNHDRDRVNVVSRIVNVAGTHQIALHALKTLKPGDELFLDYGESYLEAWMAEGKGGP